MSSLDAVALIMHPFWDEEQCQQTYPRCATRMITLAQDPFDWRAVLGLIRRAFATMEGRINPPSSLRDLTPESLAAAAEVWVLGDPPRACMVLTPKPGHLYLGKLAVEPALQGQGLGRQMMAFAEARARDLGLPQIELETRVELTENHRFYLGLGYAEAGRSAHPGFTNPTSVRYVKGV
jgi:GNAT superfamily N-acetyltransferase